MASFQYVIKGLVCLLLSLLLLQQAFAWPELLHLQNNSQVQQLQLQAQRSQPGLGVYQANNGIELYLSGAWLVQTEQQPDVQMWQHLQVSGPRLLAQRGQQQVWLVQPEHPELWFQHKLPLASYPWLTHYQPDFYSKVAKRAQQPNRKLAQVPHHQAILTLGYWQQLQQQSAGKDAVVALIDDEVDLTQPSLSQLKLKLYYDVDLKQTTLPTAPQAYSHGNGMAGLIFAKAESSSASGLAPQAQAVMLKQSLGWTSDILLALHVAELSGADIVNCSWTLPFLSDLIAGKISSMVSNTSTGRGMAMVVAAGNRYQEVAEQNPLAALPEVISVGLLDRQLQPLSNSGKVDIWVQGPLSLPSGKAISGSSAAAAVVSGVLALKRSLDPDTPMLQLTEQLKNELTSIKQ